MKYSKNEMDALFAAVQRVNVPLNKLKLSTTYQARTTVTEQARLSLSALAVSIKNMGLLQNLVVVEAGKGNFEVCAGGRRLEAMQSLVKSGDWAGTHPIPVLVIAAEHAAHASLIENEFRAAMHHADTYAAYAALRSSGKSIEEIAASQGVAVASVKRLLTLADVAPSLLQKFRADELTLDDMMALAGVSDHAHQEAAWEANKNHGKEYRAREIRRMLSQDDISSSTPLGRFVGVDAYRSAGGDMRQDLFAQGTEEFFFSDLALVERLAVDKMKSCELAAEIASEGWKWVEFRPEFRWEHEQSYGSANRTRRELTPEESAISKDMSEKATKLRDEICALEDAEADEDLIEAEYRKLDVLELGEQEVHKRRWVYSSEMKAISGCVLCVDQSGTVIVKRGLIRAEDRAEAVAAQAGEPVGNLQLPSTKTRPVHSQPLVDRLMAQKVAALQASLVERPNLGLCLLVRQMFASVFDVEDSYRVHKVFHMSFQNARPDLCQADQDIESSKAWQCVQKAIDTAKEGAPSDYDELLPWLLQQTQDKLVSLLNVLSSLTIYRKDGYQSNRPEHLDELARLIQFDMADWWEPTPLTYFNHVSKDRIAEVVTSVCDEPTGKGMSKLKKIDAAKAAGEALIGSRWLPDVLITAPDSDTQI